MEACNRNKRTPHSTEEDLLPSAKETVAVRVGKKAAKKLSVISLSDDMVKQCSGDIVGKVKTN